MKKPNILYVMTDQQRATSLDLYSKINAVPTTSLRELAEAGTVFDASYCPYPLCVPSRISALTGQYPTASGYVGNDPWHVGAKMENLFSHARDNGYWTALVGKDHALALPCKGVWGADTHQHTHVAAELWHRLYSTWHGPNMTSFTNRDQPHIQPFLRSTPELQVLWGSAVAPWNGEDSISARMCDVTCEFLTGWQQERAQADSPFFMWLSFPDPHEFYQAPQDVFDSIDPSTLRLPANWNYDLEKRAEYIQFMEWYFNSGGIPEEVVMKLIRVYLAMCKNVDIQLNKVFSWLKANGQWENTIILYCSDHGDFTGEHRLLQKFNAGYDGCCRVPLIMAWPGTSIAGRHCSQPVNLADIPSTLCELAGLPRMAMDQGVSFADQLTSAEPAKRPYTVVTSGLYGESLTMKDIPNFEGHRWDVEPDGRWCYDPPHRFGGRMYVVRSERYKLITRQDQSDEFYDLLEDPWETRNLAGEASMATEINKHKDFLIDHLSRTQRVQEGTGIAPQDDFYRAGGPLSWDDSLLAHRANGSSGNVHKRSQHAKADTPPKAEAPVK